MSRENTMEFISIYQSEPCLWQSKCKGYHNRSRRDEAYARLAENLRQVEPTATIGMVPKKINILRSSYRKERRRVEESMKSGSGSEVVYKPTLWYFELLRFLDDCDPPKLPHPVIDGDADAENEDVRILGFQDEPLDFSSQDSSANDETANSVAGTSKPSEPKYFEPRSRKRSSQMINKVQTGNDNLAKKVMTTLNEHFKMPFPAEDRFDIFGKGVAIKLRSLPRQQMLFAEKIINDVIFYADMGQLDISTRLTIDNEDTPMLSQNRLPTSSSDELSPVGPAPHKVSPNATVKIETVVWNADNSD